MEAIYREYILDHFQHPSHRGKLDSPTVTQRDSNPLCGDDITMEILINSAGSIEDCGFLGHGCAISLAAADMLCTDLIGKDAGDVINMSRDDMLELLGIELGPVRVKCGLLAYKAVKMGLIKHVKEAGEESTTDETSGL